MFLYKYFIPFLLFFTTSLYAGGLKVSGETNFQSVEIGTSHSATITFKNNSRKSIILDGAWFENSNELSYSNSTCSFTGKALRPKQQCFLSIIYSPQKVNSYTSKFVVGYLKGRKSRYRETNLKLQLSSIQGTPPQQGPPSENHLILDLLDSDDLKTQVGKKLEIHFQVNNTLDHKIRIDEFWINIKSKDFELNQGNCPGNLNSGQKCQLSVTYSPTSSGVKNDTLTMGYYNNNSWVWNELDLDFSITVKKNNTTTPPLPPTSPAIGRLHVEGNKIVNDQGDQVILKGVNIADPEHLNTKENTRPGVSAHSVAMNAVNEYNAKVIRLPILPGSPKYPTEGWFGPENGGEDYFNNHIDPLVTTLTSQNIYVIIDLHYISDYLKLKNKVLDFWEFMAPKYKDNPYVIYELMNEPILPDDWNTFKRVIAQPGVDMIRKHAPETLIIVGSPYWSSHLQDISSNPVEANNIIYTAHIYSNQRESTWEKNYGEVMDKYPVMVTEWGFEKGGVEGGTQDFGIPFMNFLKKRNLSWTAWCFDNRWGPRMFDNDWNLLDGHGGMGQFVKDNLK